MTAAAFCGLCFFYARSFCGRMQVCARGEITGATVEAQLRQGAAPFFSEPDAGEFPSEPAGVQAVTVPTAQAAE